MTIFAVLPVFAAENVIFTQSQNFTLSATNDVIQILHSGTNISIDTVTLNTNNLVLTIDDDDTVTLVNSDKKMLDFTNVSGVLSVCGTNDFRITIPDQNATVTTTITIGSACSTGGGAPPAPTPTPTTPSTATGNVTATASLGGNTTATTSDGNTAKVDVPSTAISVDTTFAVAPTLKTSTGVATQIAAVPSGQQLVGANIYSYTATAEGASVTSFASEVTLTFTYTDAQVAGFTLSSLKVHKYDESTGTWTALATTVNTATKTVTATTNSFSYFAIFGSAEAVEAPVTETPTPEVSLVDTSGTAIVDGDLITTDASFDIYIIKLINDKKFKRLILNPDIFNSYGHLKWDNVKTVSQEVQDAYTVSSLVIEVNPDGSVFDPKVYSVTSAQDADVGEKHWVNLTAAGFVAAGYDWDSIYHINHTEASPNFYPLGAEITS